MAEDLSRYLTVTEIFHSIQGESYLSGLPFVFVRLTGCHQRCVYCDTEYAFFGGEKIRIADILKKVESFPCRHVLITGGEPLLQVNCGLLAEQLLQKKYHVSVETSGDLDVRRVPKEVIKIMDLKTPESGESHRNCYENLNHLDEKDEVKFVNVNLKDVMSSLEKVREYQITKICHVSFSVTDLSLMASSAELILKSGLPIRLQFQLHKMIWPHKERGY